MKQRITNRFRCGRGLQRCFRKRTQHAGAFAVAIWGLALPMPVRACIDLCVDNFDLQACSDDGPGVCGVGLPFCTIEAAVLAAAEFGDTIKVSPGTYTILPPPGILTINKKLVLVSTNGRDETTILGQVDVRGANQGRETVIDGFTITSSINDGVHTTLTGPVIRNNKITNCAGAGIFIGTAIGISPLVEGNIIGPSNGDSGIYVDGASPEIVNNEIRQNAASWGAGLRVISTDGVNAVLIRDCDFIKNQATTSGGGIDMQPITSAHSISIVNTTFRGNTAKLGGGAYFAGGINNTASSGCTTNPCDQGAANVTIEMQNVLFTCNTSEYGGGVYLASGSKIDMSNATFVHNSAADGTNGVGTPDSRGGGIVSHDACTTIANSIFWENTSSETQPNFAVENCGKLKLSYSIVEGGCAGIIPGSTGEVECDSADVSAADPSLSDILGLDGSQCSDPQDESYCLARPAVGPSPAIDSGDSTLVLDDPDTGEVILVDLDGNPRFVDDPGTIDTGVAASPPDEVVDMGAYEYSIEVSGEDANNRFISFVPPVEAGPGTALRVYVAKLFHRCSAESDNLFEPCDSENPCINGVCATNFASDEGQFRYVKPYKMCEGTNDLCSSNDDCAAEVLCSESFQCPDDVFTPDFFCATTGCYPDNRDWVSALGGQVLHVTGDVVLPAKSLYLIDVVTDSWTSCGALQIETARWADMTGDGATNAMDITAASDKIKPIPSALTKPRTMLYNIILDPTRNVNVVELQNTVDAVKSLPSRLDSMNIGTCP